MQMVNGGILSNYSTKGLRLCEYGITNLLCFLYKLAMGMEEDVVFRWNLLVTKI